MTDLETDVIVVGAGGSGLAAAVSAAEHGASVIVLEKREQPGGTTGIAVGSYTAAKTRQQRAAGIEDDVNAHAEDAGKFADSTIEARNNEPLRAYFLDQAADTLEWLQSFGLSFVGPHPEPPNRVPRMHNVVPGGHAYVAALQHALRQHQGKLICQASVTHLLQEADRVTGVAVNIAGEPREIRARYGVILAAGDYANNHQLIAEHKGTAYRDIEGINPHATGEGHQLAAAAGGQLVNMDVTYGPELRFIAPDKTSKRQGLPTHGRSARLLGAIAKRAPKWLTRRMAKRLLVTWQHPENALFDDGAILLNEQGTRFVDETRWPDREIALAQQSNKQAYILLDGELHQRYSAWPHFISTAPDIAYAYVADYLRLRPDVAIRNPGLREVCRQRNLPTTAVENTLRTLNATAKRNAPCPYGRAVCRELQSGPWVLLGPVKAYFTTTEGGARINRQMQVLDADGQVISGLYAVGQNGLSGMVLFGHGLHIAWAMTSGRLAGTHIMHATGPQHP